MYVGKNTLRTGRSASSFLQSRLRLWRKEEASAKRRLLLYGVGMIAPAFAGAERNGILFRLRIVDVQQLVRLLRRQLLIERLENRVVLRRFDKRLAVCFIKTFGACIFLLLAADGLARAADTAGRAGQMLHVSG